MEDSIATSGLAAPWSGETGGKKALGGCRAQRPAELPVGGLESAVPPPTAAPASAGLRAGTPYRHPEQPHSPRRSLRLRLSRTRLSEPQKGQEPRVLLPQPSPPPPRRRGSHLPDTSAPLPSHLTDGGAGGRPRGPAGGAGGRAAGRGRGRGAEGRPLLRPQLPALWLRLALTLALFPEPRDVTGKQPILVGPCRPPGAGHPTTTRGGRHPGVGDPRYARPSLEPTGSFSLGHCAWITHGRKCCLAGGSTGDCLAPSADFTHSLRGSALSGPAEARGFDPNRGYDWVGSARLARLRRGRAEGWPCPASGPPTARRPPSSQRRGAPSGLGRSREERPRSARDRSPPVARSPPPPRPGSLPPRSRPGDGCAPSLQPQHGKRGPSSRGLKGEFANSCLREPHWPEPRDLWPCLNRAGGSRSPRLGRRRDREPGDFSTSESSGSALTLRVQLCTTRHL
ncbi:uncharacterized protein [Saccopteryx leptura]|uniref:uncharacterized protein n=1 Tax=Saccopteryx leptura TaxID=249018 RepID=UPI00339BDA33